VLRHQQLSDMRLPHSYLSSTRTRIPFPSQRVVSLFLTVFVRLRSVSSETDITAVLDSYATFALNPEEIERKTDKRLHHQVSLRATIVCPPCLHSMF